MPHGIFGNIVKINRKSKNLLNRQKIAQKNEDRRTKENKKNEDRRINRAKKANIKEKREQNTIFLSTRSGRRTKECSSHAKTTGTKKRQFLPFFIFFTWCPKQICNYVRIGVRSMKQWKCPKIGQKLQTDKKEEPAKTHWSGKKCVSCPSNMGNN